MSMVRSYESVFADEQKQSYPVIAAFEAKMGAAVDRRKLEKAARVLACPLKLHAPNWQHGRVIYAAALNYLRRVDGPITVLDIGTAKGFSALCLTWACDDANANASIVSLDVIKPEARVWRNSVLEQELGALTLREFLKDWPETESIIFQQADGATWLNDYSGRVHIAFVDGKHTYPAVKREAELLTMAQHPGDLIIFDDVQVPGVWAAVQESTAYLVDYIEVLPHRKYAVAKRK